jgi:autotransporter-associated beta strand protein
LNGATGTNNSSLTVVLANGASTTFNGTIGYVGGGLPANQSGRFTVNLGGNATLVLGGSNGYSGPTVIGRTAGGAQTASTTVQLASASALGVGSASSTVSIGQNATLDLNGQAVTSNYAFVTVQGAGVGGAGSLVNSSATTPVSLSWGVQLSGASGSAIGGAGDLTLTGAVTNFGLLQKVGAGVLTLTNTSNSWSGGTSINAGTLRLGAANVLPGTTGSARLLINGGTLSTGAATGFGDTDAGTIKVTGTGSKIGLGTGSHTLTFASFDPTGFTTLTIDGWTGTAGASGTGGRIVITDATALLNAPNLSDILGHISFTGYDPGAVLLGSGSTRELAPVPVPEPALTLALGAAGLGGVGLAVRRRVRATAVARR